MAHKAKQARLDFSVLGQGQQEPWVILALLQPARLFYQVKKDSITVGKSRSLFSLAFLCIFFIVLFLFAVLALLGSLWL